MAGDSLFASVELLLLCNGTNNSTTFTDSSNRARTCTANGNAKLTTTSPKYGTACATFDGTGDTVTIAGTDNVTGGWTLDLWTKNNNTGAMICVNNNPRATGNWEYRNQPDTQFRVGTGSSYMCGWSGAGLPADGNWHHHAICRDPADNKLRMFGDGVFKEVSSSTWTEQMGNTSGVILGRWPVVGLDYSGQEDCIRITSACRWPGTTSFTPPTSEDDYLPVTGGPFPHYLNDSLKGGLVAMRERLRRATARFRPAGGFFPDDSGLLLPRPGLILPRG